MVCRRWKSYGLVCRGCEAFGRQVLEQMKDNGIKTPVIVISAVGVPDVIGAELKGKYGVGFVSKPHMGERLISEIQKAIAGEG